MAFNRAATDVLYPPQAASVAQSYGGAPGDLSINNFFVDGPTSAFFETSIRAAADDDDTFQIILDQEVRFEAKTGQNLLAKATSDFLRADVNFMLINTDSKHVYRPQHRMEDTKKLLVNDLPAGVYRLVIFVQNCESRNLLGTPLRSQKFSFRMGLWSFEKSGRSTVSYKEDGDWKRKPVPQRYITAPTLLCAASNRQLPADLTRDVFSHDFMLKFSLPENTAFTKTQEISYTADPDMDMLRIQIDEGIKVKLYKKTQFDTPETSVAISNSHNKLGENIHELVAKGLNPGTEYVISLIFDDEDDDEGYSSSQCTEAQMQVRIASSNDDAEGCKSGSVSALTEGLPTEVALTQGNSGP